MQLGPGLLFVLLVIIFIFGTTDSFAEETAEPHPSVGGGMEWPTGFAFSPHDGNLYVASQATNEVLRYDGTTGKFIDVFVKAGYGGLNHPTNLFFNPNDDNMYVVKSRDGASPSSMTASLLRYDGITGKFIDVFMTTGISHANRPDTMAFSPHDGNLYIVNMDTKEIMRYDGITGKFIDVFVTSSEDDDSTKINPTGLAFSPHDGNLYVGGGSKSTVLRYDGITGKFIDVFGTKDNDGYGISGILFFEPINHNLLVARDNDILRFDKMTGEFIDSFVHVDDVIFWQYDVDGVAFSPHDDSLFISDRGDSRILQYDGNTGEFVGTFVFRDDGRLRYPVDLMFNTHNDELYVSADDGILRYDYTTGLFIDYFFNRHSDNLGKPRDIMFGPDGNYVYALSNVENSTQILRYDVSNTSLDSNFAVKGKTIEVPPSFTGLLKIEKITTPVGSFVFSPHDGDLYVTTIDPPDNLFSSVNDIYSYSSGYQYNNILQYDINTGKFIDTFVTGSDSDLGRVRDLAFSPYNDNLYVLNYGFDYRDGKDVLQYDGKTGEFVGVFAVIDRRMNDPTSLQFGPVDNNLYVTNTITSEILRYDGITGEFIDSFKASSPTRFVFDPHENILYSISHNKSEILRYDGITGEFIDSFVSKQKKLSLDSSESIQEGKISDNVKQKEKRKKQSITFSGTINDNETCELAGGFWTTPNTCAIDEFTKITVRARETLEISERIIFDNSGTIDSSGTINNYGTILNKESATLGIPFGNINNYGTIDNSDLIQSGTLTNYGTIDNSGRIVNILGQFIVNEIGGIINNSGKIISGSGNNITNSGTINNYNGGVISSDPGSGIKNLGTINNDIGGSIEHNHDVDIFDSPIYNSGEIKNSGTINSDGKFSIIVNAGTITNSGTIDNSVNGAIENNGTINNSCTGILIGTIPTRNNPVVQESSCDVDDKQQENEKGQKIIPDWIKNNAGWWAEGTISNTEFTSGIQYLVEKDIIQISETKKSVNPSHSQEIPKWIKNNADWWSQGLISDDDFIKGVKYLVENGVIVIS